MAMGIVFLIGFAALAIAQDPATAPSPTTVSSVAQIEIQSPEDLALVVFMRSVFARTQGDARIARGYLSDKLFTDDELARLVAVSKDVAPLAAQLEAKPNWPTKQPTVSRDGRTVQIGFGGAVHGCGTSSWGSWASACSRRCVITRRPSSR